MRYFYRLFLVLLFNLFFGSFFVREAQASQLVNVKDQITTSRPSASAPISALAASGVSQFSIANNGSRFLASDSAQVIRGTGVISMSGLNVASQSADLQTVYLGQTTSTLAGAGSDTLIVPITAKHTISFQTATFIPSNGKIKITFPGSANNSASPSATTFAFNNLASGDITFSSGSTTCGSYTISSPSITCNMATAAINPGATVTITLASKLINPTKTNSTAGQADTWKVSIQTQDNSSNGIDDGTTKIATVESVQVQATVEPTLTFTISGVNNNVNINTISSSCGSILTNTGINTDATSVNLGVLSNGYVSAAAQQLQVSTNAAGGYVITATSSGQLKNPSTGAIIIDANGGTGLSANDTSAGTGGGGPATIAANTPAFGIHPCGARTGGINTDQWVNAGTISTAKFMNPWNTGTNAFYATLASYSGGPVSLENTAVLYGATISGTTPAGIYLTTLTYVATATF